MGHPARTRPGPPRSVSRLLPQMLPALPDALPVDPALAAVVTAWPDLPEPIRAGILALVKASGTGGSR